MRPNTPKEMFYVAKRGLVELGINQRDRPQDGLSFAGSHI
jgi:hypothetical protein